MKNMLVLGYRGVKAVLGGHGLGRFFPIGQINDFVFNRLKSDHVMTQGHKMILDQNDSLHLSINGIYEAYETELVKKEVNEGDVVLDIGANIGYYTLIFAKLVGAKGKVFAFEPDPTNFTILRENVKNNGYGNVELINKAVSDKSGKCRLFLNEDNLADHRIYDSQDSREFIEIESVRLDDYFQGYGGRINFIKMDIEGAEYGAVQGMRNLLKGRKNVKLVSEFWPFGLNRSGVDPKEYLNMLRGHGFDVYEVNEKKKMLDLVDDAAFLNTYTVDRENYTNLLCVEKGSA